MTAKESKPLSGILFSEAIDGSGKIGRHFGASLSGIVNTENCQKRLEASGIRHSVILQHRIGDSEIPNTPAGVEIERANRANFVYKGGTYIVDGSLKGIAFQRRPGSNEISCEGSDVNKVRQVCEEQGIPFEHRGASLVITDEPGLTAVAISGGTFNGSERWLPGRGLR